MARGGGTNLILNAILRIVSLLGQYSTDSFARKIVSLAYVFKAGNFLSKNKITFKKYYFDRTDLWSAVAKKICNDDVLYLEFGVYEGFATNWWSKKLQNKKCSLHGFDSFEGLPESSSQWVKGEFNLGGKIPNFDDERIKYFKGWFSNTLPKYEFNEHETLFINMDADIYSSTKYVLDILGQSLVSGKISTNNIYIYFDEFYQVDEEGRAFCEFISKYKINYETIGATAGYVGVIFKLNI